MATFPFGSAQAQLMQRLLSQVKQKPQLPPPMQYNPGATRQFTPSPAPDVPFMPAPQVGPQQIPTGFGPGDGLIGGLGGLGGFIRDFHPNMMGGGNSGPMVQPPAPQTNAGPMVQPPAPQTNAGPQINPQIAQIGMSLMQRSRGTPMQFNPMQFFRGGR